ncbi:Transglutaminase-like superfamily protein [compost metagenome]
MRHGIVNQWLKIGLITALLTFAIPPGWGTIPAYAISNSSSGYVISSKEIQQKLIEGLEARKNAITLKYKGKTKNLDKILKQAIADALDIDPYTKYIVDRYSFSWRGTTGTAKINFQVYYRESAEQSAYVDKRIDGILKSIMQPGMNQHQRIKAIHDYVVLNLKYDEDLQKYTAYEGLRTGEAVCQGYSLLTYKLLKTAGYTSQIVEGTAGGQAHAWNLVLLDGEWYHLDTTWDDPLSNEPGQVRYEYYLRTDHEMKVDHKWTKKYPASSALYRETLRFLSSKSGTEKGVYTALEEQLGYSLYYADAAVSDGAGLQGKVKQSISAGKETVTVRYAGAENQLIKDLSALYDLDIEDIRYSAKSLEGTEDLRVEIFWRNII